MPQMNRDEIAKEFMASIWGIHYNFFRNQKLPLPLNQFAILMDLSNESYPVTIHELSESLQIKKQQMTVIISRLEAAGCISRSSKDSDRRYSEIKLTEKGMDVIKEFFSNMNNLFLTRLDKLSPEEQQRLYASFHQFNSAVELIAERE